MLLMKVEIYSLIFVCGGGRFPIFFFFFTVPFSFVQGTQTYFRLSFCPPEQCQPEPPKDFCDVIPFVLLITTEIKQ